MGERGAGKTTLALAFSRFLNEIVGPLGQRCMFLSILKKRQDYIDLTEGNDYGIWYDYNALGAFFQTLEFSPEFQSVDFSGLAPFKNDAKQILSLISEKRYEWHMRVLQAGVNVSPLEVYVIFVTAPKKVITSRLRGRKQSKRRFYRDQTLEECEEDFAGDFWNVPRSKYSKIRVDTGQGDLRLTLQTLYK